MNIPKPMTAADLLKKIEQDLCARRRLKKQESRRAAKEAALQREEGPLLRDLKAVGVSVGCIYDLVNTDAEYRGAIGVLVRHLRLPYSDPIKEGIARALTLRRVGQSVVQALIREFTELNAAEYPLAKFAIGNALSVTASKDNVSEIISLISDTKHGKGRTMLVRALQRFPSKRVYDVLQSLRSDPDVSAFVPRAAELVGKRLRRRGEL